VSAAVLIRVVPLLFVVSLPVVARSLALHLSTHHVHHSIYYHHFLFLLIYMSTFFPPANDLARYLSRTPISFFFYSYSWLFTCPPHFLTISYLGADVPIIIFYWVLQTSTHAHLTFFLSFCIIFTPFGVAGGRCTNLRGYNMFTHSVNWMLYGHKCRKYVDEVKRNEHLVILTYQDLERPKPTSLPGDDQPVQQACNREFPGRCGS